MGGLSIIGLLVGLISLLVFAYNSIMDKTTHKNVFRGPVDQSNINASGNATVATGSSKIDQNGKIIDQSIRINNSGKISGALDTISSFIDSADGLSENETRFGKLLLDSIKEEVAADKPDKNKLSEHINSISKVVESATNAGQNVKSAIELISSVI